jgi:outer membrane protein
MKKYILIVFSLFLVQPLFCQTLSLPDAVSIALKNNLDIEVLRNNVQIADINNHISIAGGLPLVTATINDNESSTNVNQKLNTGVEIKRDGASANQLNSNMTATMLLFNGYRVKYVKKRLEQVELQSLQFVNAQVQNTIAAVMTRYYDVIRQQAYTRTINQSIDVAQKRLDIVKAQQSVGLANNADLFQSQIDLSTLYQTKQSQELIIEQAKTDLLLLMNVRPDTMITIRDTIIVDRGLVLDDIMKNLNRNAELMAAEYQIRIAEQLIKETTALRYPSLRVNTGYNYNRNQQSAGLTLLNQTSGPFIGLSLGIPIYNGGVFKRQEQIAGINAKNAALQKSILLRNFSSAAVRTYQAYTMNLQQLDDQKKIVDLAKQLLSLALQRFQLRQATIVEVRQAQESFENAGLTMTNLSFAAKAAEIELLRLVNELK